MKKERVINAYEVYYRRDGVKVAKLRSTKGEVNRLVRTLKRNRRKFLGYRPVTLKEVAN